jgi:hypothetical protein
MGDLDLGLDPHVRHADQLCILGNGPCPCRRIIFPSWHIACVAAGCVEPAEYAASVRPSLVVNENVIQIHHYKSIGEWSQDIIHIILMKVVGSFVKPKGMTNHSKRPSFDLKVVFHTFVYSIKTCDS